jgi:hypothetical protein
VKTNATLSGSSRGVVLDSPAGKHLDVTIVHLDGYGHFQDSLGSGNALDEAFVELE